MFINLSEKSEWELLVVNHYLYYRDEGNWMEKWAVALLSWKKGVAYLPGSCF